MNQKPTEQQQHIIGQNQQNSQNSTSGDNAQDTLKSVFYDCNPLPQQEAPAQSSILQSQQFSQFQKSNFTRHPIKFQSTIVNSDDENDEKETNISSKKQPDQKTLNPPIPQQQETKKPSYISHQSIYKSQVIQSDSEEEEIIAPNQQKSLTVEQPKQHSNDQQVIESNQGVAKQTIECEEQQIIELDIEEVIKQSQIVMNKLMDSTKEVKKSQFSTVKILQIDSEEEDEQADNEELDDQVPTDLQQEDSGQVEEINSENRILMSVMQKSLTKSIQKQQKQQTNLNNSLKSSLKSEIFQSKIIFHNNQPVVVPEDAYFYNKINGKFVIKKQILKIQCYFRYTRKLRKEYLRKRKQNRHRNNVINELIQTEIKYVDDLNIVITQIQLPLIKKLPMKEPEFRIIFNLDSIYYFNCEFLKELLKNKDKIKPFPYIKVMENICVLLAGFKFYYDYCKGYDNASRLFQQFENNDKIFSAFIKEVQQNKLLRGLDVASYLIKPVQRLPKYILLYKDLLKHTDKEHPDYNYIERCLHQFEEINNKNNIEMKIYLDQLKLIELQQQFGSNLIIAQPNRSFIFEDVCSIYTDKLEQSIIIFAFNNLLLFAKKSLQEPLRYRLHLQLSHASYVKDKEDTNYYSYLFEVVNKTDSVIIINSDKESKVTMSKKISELIETLKQKQSSIETLRRTQSSLKPNVVEEKEQQLTNYDIKVVIVGTESRNYQSKPYTIYITHVHIEEYQTKIFVRYSQIIQIQQIVNKYDPKLKVPVFSTLNWFHSIEPRVIDERKILIEKFLQLVLNSETCQNKLEYQKQILDQLNLNSDFYKTPEKKKASQPKQGEEEMMKMILQSQFGAGLKPNMLQSMIMNRQTTNILQAQKNQAKRTSILDINEESTVVIGSEASKCQYRIDVSLMDSRVIEVGFKKTTLTLFIKNKVAKFVGLKQWVDFRLFIVDNNKDQRVIDDDEQMSAILDAHSQKAKGLTNAFKKLFVSESKFQFIFRKYFYLSWKQEEADYKLDDNRLRYTVYDVIWETKNEKYNFTFNDYCLIAALFFYSTNQPLNMVLLQKIIPKNYLKNVQERVWFEAIVKNINTLNTQLVKIQSDNSTKQRLENKRYTTSISALAQYMIMNYYKTNHLFGMSLFFVECNKETVQSIFKAFQTKINSNIFLGLNSTGLHFLRPENKTIIFTSQYEKLSETKAYTTEFSCMINNVKLNFKTQFPYEIKALISEYQSLKDFTNQLNTFISN